MRNSIHVTKLIFAGSEIRQEWYEWSRIDNFNYAIEYQAES